MLGGCHIKPEQFFNLIFGYNDIYEARVDTTTTPAGDNRWAPAAVPAGEVWVITAMQGYNLTTATGVLHCGKYDGTLQYIVKFTLYYTPTRIIDWSGVLVLHEGDYPYIMFGSCALNDRRVGHIVGYKMKLSQ